FFQAEDGIRYFHVTGVQTCALPIFAIAPRPLAAVVRHGRAAERSPTEHPLAGPTGPSTGPSIAAVRPTAYRRFLIARALRRLARSEGRRGGTRVVANEAAHWIDELV